MSNSKVDAAFHGDQSARDRAYGLSTSASGSRAETPRTEQSAQNRGRKTWDEVQAEQACGGVGAALAAVFTIPAVWVLRGCVRGLARLQRALRRRGRA